MVLKLVQISECEVSLTPIPRSRVKFHVKFQVKFLYNMSVKYAVKYVC